MTRCAIAMSAGQQSCGVGSCAKRVMPEPMANLHLSNVHAMGRPMGTPLLRSDPFALSEVHP